MGSIAAIGEETADSRVRTGRRSGVRLATTRQAAVRPGGHCRGTSQVVILTPAVSRGARLAATPMGGRCGGDDAMTVDPTSRCRARSRYAIALLEAARSRPCADAGRARPGRPARWRPRPRPRPRRVTEPWRSEGTRRRGPVPDHAALAGRAMPEPVLLQAASDDDAAAGGRAIGGIDRCGTRRTTRDAGAAGRCRTVRLLGPRRDRGGQPRWWRHRQRAWPAAGPGLPRLAERSRRRVTRRTRGGAIAMTGPRAAVTGVVRRVNGPLVEVQLSGLSMAELLEVGPARLPAEVVALRGEHATTQAYEYTGAMAPGDPGTPARPAAVGPARPGPDRAGLRRAAATARWRWALGSIPARAGSAMTGAWRVQPDVPEATRSGPVTSWAPSRRRAGAAPRARPPPVCAGGSTSCARRARAARSSRSRSSPASRYRCRPGGRCAGPARSVPGWTPPPLC